MHGCNTNPRSPSGSSGINQHLLSHCLRWIHNWSTSTSSCTSVWLFHSNWHHPEQGLSKWFRALHLFDCRLQQWCPYAVTDDACIWQRQVPWSTRKWNMRPRAKECFWIQKEEQCTLQQMHAKCSVVASLKVMTRWYTLEIQSSSLHWWQSTA
jgi:hypothetical protein